MHSRNGSNTLLVALPVPSGPLFGFIFWYMFMFRPCGEEQRRDGMAIFQLVATTYPLSTLLLAA
jgi:hypothetical protein